MDNEFSKIEELLFSEAKKIQPPAEGLRSALKRISEPVTNISDNRLNTMEANKGRAFTNNLFESIKNTMNSFWKVAVPVGLLVVVVAVIGYWRLGLMPANQAETNLSVSDRQGSVGVATEFASAEVSQSVDEIIDRTIDDEAILTADEEDASLGYFDDQALVAFDSVTTLYE